MKTKSKTKLIIGMGTFLVAVCILVISCTKENLVTNSSPTTPDASRMMPLSFLIQNGSASQTFNISCTCDGSFTFTPGPTALYYGAVSGSTRVFSNSNFTCTLLQNQYYYVIPHGGSYGSSTKCLKFKFITWTGDPRCSYNATTNTWDGLMSNANCDVTQVNLSSVPSCTPC